MRVWIDILHIPQFNFYKYFIQQLSDKGHRVYVTCLDRGRLVPIVKKELQGIPNVSVEVFGRHRMNKWSIVFESNLFRLVTLFYWRLRHHIDVSFTNGLHTTVLDRLFHKPTYTFGDDTQTKLYPLFVALPTKSHTLIYEDTPDSIKVTKGTTMRCLKEWAYLNPRTFKPNVKVLEKYGVQPKQYLFLREVSVGTVNYAAQSPQAILSISPLIQQFTQWCQAPMCNFTQSCQTPLCKNPLPNPEITQWGQSLLGNSSSSDPTITQKGQTLLCNFKVLFSLEEKHRRSEYPADWILLQEPIEDIHSLMYYAAGLVSSGDSMAREAALLGIPAYYLGVRHSMPANLAASKVANLQNETTQPFEDWLRDLAQPKGLMEDQMEGEIEATSLSPEQRTAKRVEYLSKQQDSLRQKIDSNFIDINAYMLSLVNTHERLKNHQ